MILKPSADVIKHFIHVNYGPSKTSCVHARVNCFQNVLAYFALLVSYPRKMFMKLKPSAGVTKHFIPVNYDPSKISCTVIQCTDVPMHCFCSACKLPS
jgi:hypothetical protein